MTGTKKKSAGFTLPEVLIALFIFSLVATASVYALRLGVDSRDQLTAADRELRDLQLSRQMIKEDLAQIVARPVRDEFGAPLPGAVFGGQIRFGSSQRDDERVLLSFVRAGWLNPESASPRSSLQFVEYVLREKQLLRRSRIFLDAVENAAIIERVLFDDLESAEIGFLSGLSRSELQWADAWPVGGAGAAPPRAISITTTQDGREPLIQLFWIGALGE